MRSRDSMAHATVQQHVRNPKAGKNPQGGSKSKEIKISGKKRFKKTSTSLVKQGPILEPISKALTESQKEERQAAEKQMLERMKQINREQVDTGQICHGWGCNIPIVETHIDSEAVAFVNSLSEIILNHLLL